MLTKGNKGIDFILLKDEEFLKSIISRSVRGLFLKQFVRYISIEDLILLKLLAIQGKRQTQDQVDLESLLQKPFDSKYVESWKKKLKIKK